MSKKVSSKRKSGGSSGMDAYDRLEAQVKKGGGRRSNYWKPAEGKSVIRIFGFEHDGQVEFGVEDKNHYMKTENKFIACDDGCPVCEFAEEQVEEIAKNLRPDRKYLFNAVVRGQDGEEDKQVIAQLAVSVVNGTKDDPNGILEFAKKYDAFNEKKGRDFTITRRGKGFDTKYRVSIADRATAINFKVKPVDLISKRRKPLTNEEKDLTLTLLKRKYGR